MKVGGFFLPKMKATFGIQPKNCQMYELELSMCLGEHTFPLSRLPFCLFLPFFFVFGLCFVCLFFCLFVCLFVYLCICLFVCLFVCLIWSQNHLHLALLAHSIKTLFVNNLRVCAAPSPSAKLKWIHTHVCVCVCVCVCGADWERERGGDVRE